MQLDMAVHLVLSFIFLAGVSEAALLRSTAVLSPKKDLGLTSQRSVVGSQVRELSKAEVLASMTVDKAYTALAKMNHTESQDKLMELVHRLKDGAESNGKVMSKKEYDALDTARVMLNGMMQEAMMKKELETVKCSEYEMKQVSILRDLEQDIAYVNSEAAGARSEILRAQGVMSVSEDMLKSVKVQIGEHRGSCDTEKQVLMQQLVIVKQDILVMKSILSMVCANQGDEEQQQSSFLESKSSSGAGTIVKCVSCTSGRQLAWLRQAKMQPLLASLKSDVAKRFLQENLLGAFDDSADQKPNAVHSVVLAQAEIQRQLRIIPGIDIPGLNVTFVPPVTGACDEQLLGNNGSEYRGCQDKTANGNTCQAWDDQYPHEHFEVSEALPSAGLAKNSYCRNPMSMKSMIWCYTTNPQIPWEYCEPLKQLQAPTGVELHECMEANQCKMSGANCGNMRDRFLVILAGMIDKRNSLSEEISSLVRSCKEVMTIYVHSETGLTNQISEEQTNLASATKTMTENQQSSGLYNTQHQDLDHEYHAEMTECCANKNEFTNEVCALEKIRGELYRMEGLNVYITDCEVSAWVDEECSVTCGGGKQDRKRGIIIHPANGTECLPLTMERSCSMQGCPTDCQVDTWSEWTECTAMCGGGVMQRVRSRVTEPENDGEPCPELSETKECNVGACNVDCVLADWTSWGLCSKACDSGHEQRTRPVSIPVKGQGQCIDPEDPSRMEFQDCNTYDCSEMLPPGSNRTLVKCTAMIDLVIMLDGSGSLGEYGWQSFKGMAEQLVSAMEGNTTGVNLAFMLFSGPSSAGDLENCTSSNPNIVPDVERQCGIKWVHHLSTTIDDVEKSVQAMEYPARTTLTSMAIAEAQQELTSGRQDAASVVVVITDGKPMSPIKTGQASDSLKNQGRLIFIPVGGAVTSKDSIDAMKGWASKPWEDNILPIDTFAQLNTAKTLNNIISTVCPKIE